MPPFGGRFLLATTFGFFVPLSATVFEARILGPASLDEAEQLLLDGIEGEHAVGARGTHALKRQFPAVEADENVQGS